MDNLLGQQSNRELAEKLHAAMVADDQSPSRAAAETTALNECLSFYSRELSKDRFLLILNLSFRSKNLNPTPSDCEVRHAFYDIGDSEENNICITPLQRAVCSKFGTEKMVDILLSQGARVNQEQEAEDSQYSPLMLSVCLGRVAVVKKLLEAGASTDVVSFERQILPEFIMDELVDLADRDDEYR